MTTYPFMQVDAFTTRPLAGNPCAIVFDADGLTTKQMLAIAREMNLSETAFVRRSAVADFGARYFTPAEEIPLAGHPTIATIHALVERGEIVLGEGVTAVTLELPAGVIVVEIAGDGNLPRITMSQKKPQFLAVHDPALVLPAFGLSPTDLLPGAPIQTVSTGTPQLMIPLRNHEALRRCRLDVAAYSALRARADFFSPHLFCLQGVTAQGHTFARHFGVPPDTMEDPFTGSATGGMAAYLWQYGLLDNPTFVAEQGHWMGRPGQAWVEVVGPREDIETVKVGGTAVTVIWGELNLHAS
ncbi:MAG TPA: PhzF family phenazine biosynthesis protein [Chloroflexota bacterium]|nr:PhzF family phenazine biosynthesis protein [Chloroflexota bacterium]HUM70449.1 PhzF family phenazine biosynthesis protein [Chloroflexota bacterium]